IPLWQPSSARESGQLWIPSEPTNFPRRDRAGGEEPSQRKFRLLKLFAPRPMIGQRIASHLLLDFLSSRRLALAVVSPDLSPELFFNSLMRPSLSMTRT